MKKRWLALLLALALCFSLAACSDLDEDWEDEDWDDEFWDDEDWDDDEFWDDEDWDDDDFWDDDWEDDEDYGSIGTSGDPDQTWAVYWYLCGSDLESDGGFATMDLEEMMEVYLPDNVQVVIETGGAWYWENDYVDEGLLERYVYAGDELQCVDQQPMANMGDAETLADFLTFCTDNYPADRTMVVFWDHGGGSVSGVSFDENYDYDSLTLGEMYEAFNEAFELSVDDPPIDVIGFDTCLMATIDTAYTFADIAQYMVASEEFEPGGGWLYSGFLQELADDPGMDGARLGQVICDTYMDGCGWFSEDEATLSVVDLGAIGPLLNAYDNMGAEALTYALEDPGFFAAFGREAENSENYGGNTRDMGYSNMVDLGDLARNCENLLPESAQAVLDGLDACVLYQVKGDYRENASGLSCYYSYNGDLEDLSGYLTEGCSDTFKYLYDYNLQGTMPPEGMEFIGSMGYEEEELPYVPDLEEDGMDEYPLYLDDEGFAVLELEPDIVNMLKGVYFQLAYVDEYSDYMILLGRDNDIEADWEQGWFRDNFRGVWGALDGHLVYMEVLYEADDYTSYAIPILLNGEEYNLRVIYDYDDEQFYILGARQGMDANGMADKNLVQLVEGDEITTILYTATVSGDDDFVPEAMESFTVSGEPVFEEVDLSDGSYIMMFELVDARNNTATSELVMFTMDGEYTDVEILE